jgi:hypothetical protein
MDASDVNKFLEKSLIQVSIFYLAYEVQWYVVLSEVVAMSPVQPYSEVATWHLVTQLWQLTDVQSTGNVGLKEIDVN